MEIDNKDWDKDMQGIYDIFREKGLKSMRAYAAVEEIYEYVMTHPSFFDSVTLLKQKLNKED